jgi:dTDP-4-amino-4,6-dideoxygalactose transaminase
VHLREHGIGVQVHYIPVHRQPDYIENGLSRDDLRAAERYYASCISLPLFPAMTEADVDRVVNVVGGALTVKP